jgi:cytochrome b561
MPIRNTLTRYGSVAIILHWVMALLIIGLLALGLIMVRLPISLQKLRFFGWHKEYGLLVLLLIVVRIIWRISNVVPLLPPSLANWQKQTAHLVHFAFYFFMLAMPITGWIITSSAGLPASFFGIAVLPDLVLPNENTRQLFTEIHKWLGYSLIAVICMHVGAALQHHFIYKDDILRRILP